MAEIRLIDMLPEADGDDEISRLQKWPTISHSCW